MSIARIIDWVSVSEVPWGERLRQKCRIGISWENEETVGVWHEKAIWS